jgi:epoxyqueuosine reductase QueG
MDDYSSRLSQLSFEQGATLFGVASLASIKDQFDLSSGVVKSLSHAISIGVALSDSVLEEIDDEPTKLYYHHYRQVNFLLDRIALELASFIQKEGSRSLPIPASQVVDWANQRGHLSHKLVAKQAGLGWIGRNNLLVNPVFGARIRLVTVLTDMPLPEDEPIEAGCGKCKACVSVCPAGAIHVAPENFDHMRCFEKLREFRRSGVVGQYICGVCVKACRPDNIR